MSTGFTWPMPMFSKLIWMDLKRGRRKLKERQKLRQHKETLFILIYCLVLNIVAYILGILGIVVIMISRLGLNMLGNFSSARSCISFVSPVSRSKWSRLRWRLMYYSSSSNSHNSEIIEDDDFFGLSSLLKKTEGSDDNSATLDKPANQNIRIKEFLSRGQKHGDVVKQKGVDESGDEFDVTGVVHFTSFGSVRYDSDNTDTRSAPQDSDANVEANISHNHPGETQTDPAVHGDLGYIDSQYFSPASTPAQPLADTTQQLSQRSTGGSGGADTEGGSFIDDQYFGPLSDRSKATAPGLEFVNKISLDPLEAQRKSQRKFGGNVPRDSCSVKSQAPILLNVRDEPDLKVQSELGDVPQIPEEAEGESVVVKGVVTKQEQRRKNMTRPNLEAPETAFDLAMKIRRNIRTQQREKVGKYKDKADHSSTISSPHQDSKGFWNPRHQVQDFDKLSREVVIKILSESVVFNDDNLIVLNKPYGLSVMNEKGGYQHHSLQRYLPQLKQAWQTEWLGLLHRLDKATTGVILLAKNVKTAESLSEKFRNHEIIKKYLAITKGVPDPAEAVIDIPIGEGKIGSKFRMVLKPIHQPEWSGIVKRSKTTSKPATTSYRVLNQSEDLCALLSITPKTGVRHQIRCHLGFGIHCPILGDHKYSYLSKLVPQRLPGQMLQMLNLRQSKVRNLPLHLHSRAIIIPGYYEDGRNLHIQAALPYHMVQQIRALRLKTKNI